jgi:hypothetical protein
VLPLICGQKICWCNHWGHGCHAAVCSCPCYRTTRWSSSTLTHQPVFGDLPCSLSVYSESYPKSVGVQTQVCQILNKNCKLCQVENSLKVQTKLMHLNQDSLPILDVNTIQWNKEVCVVMKLNQINITICLVKFSNVLHCVMWTCDQTNSISSDLDYTFHLTAGTPYSEPMNTT